MLKPDLYNLIKVHKLKYRSYETDSILPRSGHDILRLPPNLNPIELVWASLTDFVAKRNDNFSFNDIGTFYNKFFEHFSTDDSKSRCKHVINKEKNYTEKEYFFDDAIDEVIINLGKDSETCSKDDTGTDNDLSGVDELGD